jgi:hypothetical protein
MPLPFRSVYDHIPLVPKMMKYPAPTIYLAKRCRGVYNADAQRLGLDGMKVLQQVKLRGTNQ